MDEILEEFLAETAEGMAELDVELLRLEREPGNTAVIGKVFRIVHSLKGTCGFLDLPRLSAMAHALESVLSRLRGGAVALEPTTMAAIFATTDRIKAILAALRSDSGEPEQADDDVLDALRRIAGADDDPAPDAVANLPAASSVGSSLVRPLGEAWLQDESVAVTHDIATPHIRVRLDLIEQLMAAVGELVVTRNQLSNGIAADEAPERIAMLQRLDRVTTVLQDGIVKTRMQPIRSAWSQIPRLVRTLNSQLGKRIELRMFGADTELDRQILEAMRDPLTHLVRNSADHGIEAPEERRRVGKPETGVIVLAARHDAGHVIIEISDDGRGLDRTSIRERAVRLGCATEDELARMDERQLQGLVFRPGFSTARTVSSVSGRGVGMDVVRRNIEAVGGTVELSSVPGEGTRITITVPLTLAIIPALIVAVGVHKFAIPQMNVIELLAGTPAERARIERIAGTPVLHLRDEFLSLAALDDLLRLDGGCRADDRPIVVMRVGSHTFGLRVDAIQGTEDIVVNPVSRILRHITFFGGNAILGDGTVALLLESVTLAEAVGRLAVAGTTPLDAPSTKPPAGPATVPLLLFRQGGRLKGAPVATVLRLEEFPASAVQIADSGPVVAYRGTLLPLICGEGAMARGDLLSVVVLQERGFSAGLVVDAVVDAVDCVLDLHLAGRRADVLGSCLIDGQAVDVIDSAHFVVAAHPQLAAGSHAPAHETWRRLPRLLLVEDSAFHRSKIVPSLSGAGYEVTATASADEALAAQTAQGPFDMLLADIELPDGEGARFVRAAAGDARYGDQPVIGLCGDDEASVLDDQPIRLTARVAKCDLARLRAVIAALLGRRA